MSKSKGNLVLVSHLRDQGADPMAIRLALLGHHYRTEWSWTPADLTQAEARLARWRAALTAPPGPVTAAATLAAVRTALRDDLRADRALAAVDAWAAGPAADDRALAAAATDALLGVRL